MLWPLPVQMLNWLPDTGDPVLNTWILSWDTHALLTNPLQLFNANTFYPLQNSLALSEHMLPHVLIFAPVYLITNNPILASNILYFCAFFLTGLSMFWLVKELTGDYWAALFAGIAFTFCPSRMAQLGHVQLLTFFYMPLVFLFFERFRKSLSWKHGILFAIFLLLQTLCSYYLGYFTVIGIFLYGSWYLVKDKLYQKSSFIFKSLVLGMFYFAGVMSLTWPYLIVKKQWNLTRTLSDLFQGSVDLCTSYFVTPYSNLLYGSFSEAVNQDRYFWELPNFPGIVVILLTLTGLFLFLKYRDKYRFNRGPFVLIGVVAFILSLGPFLIFNKHVTFFQLPYFWFYDIVPGFSSLRVPARLGVMVMFVLTIISAYTIAELHQFNLPKTLQKYSLIPLALIFLMLCENINIPIHTEPISFNNSPSRRDMLRLKDDTSAKAILHFPIYNNLLENKLGHRIYEYMLLSTIHWKPIVNGFSGYYPQITREMVSVGHEFYKPANTWALAAMGVNRVVVHKKYSSSKDLLNVKKAEESTGNIQKLWETDQLICYSIHTGGTRATQTQWVILPRDNDSLNYTVYDNIPLNFFITSVNGDYWIRDNFPPNQSLNYEWFNGREKISGTMVFVYPSLIFGTGWRRQLIEVPAPDKPGSWLLTVQIRGTRYSMEQMVTITE